MPYQLCLEEMESRWIAHVPALPGCFASEADREAAVAKAPRAIVDYLAWLRAHGEPVPDGPVSAEVIEIHRAWHSTPDNEVNAFFAADRPPLAADEIAHALKLLEWTRADLLASVEGLSPDQLAREVENRWSIRGILNHTGRGELWYLDRLGLGLPRDGLPKDVFEQLETVRSHFRSTLSALAGEDRVSVADHEHWSPRKMLRRALWHERDHTNHVLQFRERLE